MGELSYYIVAYYARTPPIDSGIIIAIVTLIQGVGVAVIAGLFARHNKKEERRGVLRVKESRLVMTLMQTGVSLSIQMAEAIKMDNPKINGSMDEFMLKAKEAQSKYKEFVEDVAVEKLTD